MSQNQQLSFLLVHNIINHFPFYFHITLCFNSVLLFFLNSLNALRTFNLFW